VDYDRLRELQQKFDENPRRYFAPLANEYRKGGQPKRAIEICRAHLAQMPGHMSGQIVFGQALFEAGEWDEARAVFGRALALDPENLIALRSLGDMALQAGDTAEARTWYTRLLDADPKDAAVIALVSEIDATGVTSSSPPPEISTAEPDRAAQQVATAPEPEAAAPESEAAAPHPERVAKEIEQPLGLERHYPSEPEADAGSAEQLAAESGEAIAGVMSSRKDDAGALSWTTPPGFTPVQQQPPVQAETAPAQHEPAAAEPKSAAAEPEPATPEFEPVVAEHQPPAAEHRPPRVELEPVRPAPAAAKEERAFSGASAEPFVNETMAQLYLQQGYRQLALKVYRQLSASRPHDQALRERIAEIEAADAADHPDEVPAMRREEPSIERPAEPAAPQSPSIESPTPWSQPGSEETPEFDRSPVDSPPTARPSRDRESIESPSREEPAAEPEGYGARQPSIREFFATLGRRRPPRPAGSQPMRSNNARPADTAPPLGNAVPSASLDAVFAGATVSPSDARAASRLAGAFSGATGSGSRTPPTPPVPTPRVNPRLPQTQESEEDVAKFRAWLDGLTRE
jgi:tetratricopeptide (TPR) repeat protein